MFSILLSALVVIVAFNLYKKNSSKTWGTVLLIALNWCVVEIGVFIYLLGIIHSGNFLFLIGNQRFLDYLIKKDIVEAIITQKNDHNAFYQIDPDLGYTLGKNKNYWVYHSSNQGLRADREYSLTPSNNMLRVALFGDSFVFCDGEPLENSWPYMLQQNVKGLEVLNFGVSGYGLSSAILRYLKEGRNYHPDIVFINYVLLGNRDWIEGSMLGGTDLKRSTLYRPLLTLNNGTINVQRFNPLDLFDKNLRLKYLYFPIGENDSHLISWTNLGLLLKNIYLQKEFNEKYNAQGNNVQLNEKRLIYNVVLLEQFLTEAYKQHSIVIFFYDEDFSDLPYPIQQVLREHEQNVIYINGIKILKGYFDKFNLTPKDYLNTTNHYNAIGNRLYAQIMAVLLTQNHWGVGNRTFEYCSSTHEFQNIKTTPCL